MAFTEDLTQFFDEDDFAVTATIALSGGGNRVIKAIFNSPSQSVQLYDTSVEANAPALLCRTADLAGIKRQSEITVEGKTYRLERVFDDGTGISTVSLT